MEWSIQEVARIAGVTSRALRHYDDIGLLRPSRIGANGYRYYDQERLTVLQRILLLRALGLGLPAIAGVLSRETDAAAALTTHAELLRQEQTRIARQLASIERTLSAMRTGGELEMSEMFDGFDHTAYREEVEERWGAAAYAKSARWWEAKSADEKAEWQRAQRALAQDWVSLARSGADPDGEEAQALAERHVTWLSGIPGTPATDARTRQAYVLGLAAMYVADPRFAANYGGEEGAEFVRHALERYAQEQL